VAFKAASLSFQKKKVGREQQHDLTIELIVNFLKCQTANGCKFLIKRMRVGMIYCQMGTYQALRNGLPSIGIRGRFRDASDLSLTGPRNIS
jgi:hypothetical protein